jgi:hypothetical protein
MEPEGSVMYPKQLIIGLYLEPDESSAQLPNPFI